MGCPLNAALTCDGMLTLTEQLAVILKLTYNSFRAFWQRISMYCTLLYLPSVADSGRNSPLNRCNRAARVAANTMDSGRRPGVSGPTRGLAAVKPADVACWSSGPLSGPAQHTGVRCSVLQGLRMLA